MQGTMARGGQGLPREELERAVIRFAGDSGDGMQLVGGRFTLATALAGNDLATFPDFPAEIRAPAGTTFGVSAFQINFGARSVRTIGDQVDVLVAMNPAALKVSLDDLKDGGLIVVDSGSFSTRNLAKAGLDSSPLEDATLEAYRVLAIDMSKQVLEAVKPFGLNKKEGLRCKNLWALGLVYWLFDRDRDATTAWLRAKFKDKRNIAEANVAALNAGHAYAETAELSGSLGAFSVPPAAIEPGLYRNVTGSQAMAWGLVTGARLAGLDLTFCSYPITPASQVLHTLASLGSFGVKTFQAEDEIAAVCAAIGASYAGSLGVTSSSGPGIALKGEALSLAVVSELPLVVLNTQRAGPSTGMPTKTEQSDLFQAVFGRNGDSPLVVLAARSPGDCFDVAIEAARLATRYMTPVMVLSDGFIANASEPWAIPDVAELEPFPVYCPTQAEGFHAFVRDPKTLARPWIRPGTPGLEHRIGGLEKDFESGHISYDPANHQRMTKLRAEKIARVVDDIPLQRPELGGSGDRLAVVGWGSTYGPISRAVSNLRAEGLPVSHIHLRHLFPLPKNLGDLLSGYEKILVPEMNHGQLLTWLRSTYLVPAHGLEHVTGKPFRIDEIEAGVRSLLHLN